jgi:DNA-binding LytR/AlgR family response regulator
MVTVIMNIIKRDERRWNVKVKVNEGHPELEVIINCPQVTEEVNRMTAVLQTFDRRLSGTKDGYLHMIEWQDVLYIEAVDRRCFIYTADDVYETALRLYEIDEMLSDIGFFRSSKSQVVNMAKISSLCPDFGGRIEAVIENGEKLIVSRQYARLLKERLGVI